MSKNFDLTTSRINSKKHYSLEIITPIRGRKPCIKTTKPPDFTRVIFIFVAFYVA